jgi:hypothetical protein
MLWHGGVRRQEKRVGWPRDERDGVWENDLAAIKSTDAREILQRVGGIRAGYCCEGR